MSSFFILKFFSSIYLLLSFEMQLYNLVKSVILTKNIIIRN